MLPPTQLLIFCSAKSGTPLMQSNQQIRNDLSLKMLASEDSSGKTWLTYPNFHFFLGDFGAAKLSGRANALKLQEVAAVILLKF